MLWRCSIASLAFFAGCAIELDDVPGRACDELHACRLPRVCAQGACVEPVDAGPADAGIAAHTDAGLARWQQRLHGFTTATIDPPCALDIDPSRGNRVLATIRGAGDDEDTATAGVTDVERLPRGMEGRVRGRVTLPAPVQVKDFVPLLFVGTQTGQAFARAGFDGAGRLRVESDATTVGTAPLVESFTVDGGFVAGDWEVEIAWRVGAFREVRLNGALLANTAVSGGTSTPPSTFSLGPARYDGDAGEPFSVTLSAWQLADELSVVLAP